MPALDTYRRVVDRDRTLIVTGARDIGWPVQAARTFRTAHGLYLSSPPQTPLWAGVAVVDRVGENVVERLRGITAQARRWRRDDEPDAVWGDFGVWIDG